MKAEDYVDDLCGTEELWDGSKKECVKRTDTEMVGDDKLPNRYFVSLGNSEYICHEGSCDWDESIEAKGGTVAVFDTFKEALEFMKSIPIDEYVTVRGEGFIVTSKTIEDRLSGEIASEIVENWTRTVKERDADLHLDTHFTENRMAERGVKFV